jgi:LSD1 subclass zinc finger protein
MPVQMICPNLQCRKVLSVPDEVRGKQVKCQHCQTVFRVPEARKPTAIPAPATSAPK